MQSPQRTPPPQPVSPRILALVSTLDGKLAAAHSATSVIADAVNRVQAPAPQPGQACEARASGSTLEERLETALMVADGLSERLSLIAQRLDSLV